MLQGPTTSRSVDRSMFTTIRRLESMTTRSPLQRLASSRWSKGVLTALSVLYDAPALEPEFRMCTRKSIRA